MNEILQALPAPQPTVLHYFVAHFNINSVASSKTSLLSNALRLTLVHTIFIQILTQYRLA